MASATFSDTPWRRHLLGACGLVFLLLGMYFYLWPVRSASSDFFQGVGVKTGLVLLAVWLAFPQLDRMPGWIFVALLGTLLALVLRPRIVAALLRYSTVLIPILIVIWILRRLSPNPSQRR
jgi:hypothetical protein